MATCIRRPSGSFSEAGAALIEYVLLAALIVIACVVAITTVGGQSASKFNTVSTVLEEHDTETSLSPEAVRASSIPTTTAVINISRLNSVTCNKSYGVVAIVTSGVPAGVTATQISVGEDTNPIMFWETNGNAYISAKNSGYKVKAPQDCDCMFYGNDGESDSGAGIADKIDVTYLDTSETTSMSAMFCGTSAKEITGLGGLDTSKVTSMSSTFEYASQIQNISDINNWNTSSLKRADSMFADAGYSLNIDTLDLSNWDTRNLENTFGMFISWGSGFGAKNIDLSGWDTSSLKNTQEMFYGCKRTTHIYVGSKWNLSGVKYSSNMVAGCTCLARYSTIPTSSQDKTYAYAGGDGKGLFDMK